MSGTGDWSAADLAWLAELGRPAGPGECRVCGAPLTQVTVRFADPGSPDVYACPEARPFAFREGSEDFVTGLRHYFGSRVEVPGGAR